MWLWVVHMNQKLKVFMLDSTLFLLSSSLVKGLVLVVGDDHCPWGGLPKVILLMKHVKYWGSRHLLIKLRASCCCHEACLSLIQACCIGIKEILGLVIVLKSVHPSNRVLLNMLRGIDMADLWMPSNIDWGEWLNMLILLRYYESICVFSLGFIPDFFRAFLRRNFIWNFGRFFIFNRRV